MKLEPSTFFGSKVGLLGGTFDPVHNGHLFIADAVNKKLQLDSVLFVPAASPPHKLDYAISPFEDRCGMLEIALADTPHFFYTSMEQERSGPSFTIDTLISLNRFFPETHFYFVIGSDAFADIGTWKRYHDIPNFCHLVVIRRGATSSAETATTVAQVYPEWTYSAESGSWQAPLKKGVIMPMDLPPVALSSTMIRSKVQEKSNIEGMVPEQVALYIQNRDLYLVRDVSAGGVR